MSTTTLSTSHRQMIDRANAELLLLQRQYEEASARFKAIQANARAVKLATLRETVKELRANYEAQQAHADLALYTPEEATASAHLKQQERHLKQQEKALAALVDTSEREQARDNARRVSLEADYDQINARLSAIRTKRIATEKAKELAFTDLGESEHRDIVTQITLAQASITAKERELANARQALVDVVNEGVERLGQWPEHRCEIRLIVPVEDEATRVLEAAIALYDALLKEGSRVTIDTDTFRRVHPFVSSLAHMLWLEERDVYPALNGRVSEARKLTERISDMRKLRSLHQDSLREREG